MSASTRFGSLARGTVWSCLLLVAACGRGTARDPFTEHDAGYDPSSAGDSGSPSDASAPADARPGDDAAAPTPPHDAQVPSLPDAQVDPDLPDAGPAADDGDWIMPTPGALAATPPMGWNSWNKYGCAVSEKVIRDTADALVATGMRDLGYRYLNIDDCWQSSRASNGTILHDQNTFPSGIKALADYVHDKGLKLGVYSDRGTQTCAGRPGSQGYETLDASQYASWGVDYLKYDNCHVNLDAELQYGTMQNALAATGKPIVFSICAWAFSEYMPGSGQLWRTTNDIQDNWGSVMGILDVNSRFAAYAGPSGWNDPDMLEVGNGGMTTAEYRSHFSLWAMMAAPLIAGNDLTTMSDATRTILTNAEVIAVDQDPLGYQGYRVKRENDLELWAKPLAGSGVRAVLLFNRSGSSQPMTVKWLDIGLSRGMATVHNMWAHGDHGTFEDEFTFSVPAHDVAMLRIVGQEPLAPRGNVLLTDLQWTYAANGWGPVELNMSVGNEGSGDGKTISIAGTMYDRGLGVHAGSLLRYRLAGRCTRFRADVGVDDESDGSVVFEVLVDGQPVYTSPAIMKKGMKAAVDVDVTGGRELKLKVTNGRDTGEYDHAAWGNPRLDCAE
jgi:alpha-galactosidase